MSLYLTVFGIRVSRAGFAGAEKVYAYNCYKDVPLEIQNEQCRCGSDLTLATLVIPVLR